MNHPGALAILAISGFDRSRINEVGMSIVVLLLETADASFGIGPNACRELARLGVRRVAVMQDGATVGVLLEGWAFDSTSTGRAIKALDAQGVQPQVLLPVLDMSVAATDANTPDYRSSEGEVG